MYCALIAMKKENDHWKQLRPGIKTAILLRILLHEFSIQYRYRQVSRLIRRRRMWVILHRWQLL